MLLSLEEAGLFFQFHNALLCFMSQRLDGRSDERAAPEEFSALPLQTQLDVRRAFSERLDLLDSFVEENPAHLSEEELAIVSSWRHRVAGRFYVLRDLKKYTVFLSISDSPVAYGVTALRQPFEELVGPHLPVMVDAILMPFKDKIVYDGMLNCFNISFGPGIRRNLYGSYQAAKARLGVVTSLPICDSPAPTSRSAKVVKKKPGSSVGADNVMNLIIGMTDQFCRSHLNDEYASLCRKLTAKLAQKRPSPLASGKPNTWACGIIRTIGWVNFLEDKSQKPYLKMTAIDTSLGVASSTGQGKSKTIRSMLKIRYFDPEWTVPSRENANPLLWMFKLK